MFFSLNLLFENELKGVSVWVTGSELVQNDCYSCSGGRERERERGVGLKDCFIVKFQACEMCCCQEQL